MGNEFIGEPLHKNHLDYRKDFLDSTKRRSWIGLTLKLCHVIGRILDGDLKALDLSHNGLYGKVPRTLCTMFELRSLSVRFCLDFKSVVNDKLYLYFVNMIY